MKLSRLFLLSVLVISALALSFVVESATPVSITSFAAIGLLGFPEERIKPQRQHGPGMEIVTGFTTAANVTFTGIAGGDFAAGIYAVKSYRPGTKAWLFNMWSQFQSGTPIVRVSSAGLHDSTSPIRVRPISAQVYPLLANGTPQVLQPQDRLLVEHQGSAVAGDIESTSLLIYYQDQPGCDTKFISEDELDALSDGAIVTVEVPLTAGVAGGYSGGALLNSGTYTLVNNRRYAILGGHSSVMQTSIAIRGTDFGNLRLGFPGNAADKDVNSNFFVNLSRNYGGRDPLTGVWKKFPSIPTFDSGNANSITVETVNNENAASPVVTLLLARLNG